MGIPFESGAISARKRVFEDGFAIPATSKAQRFTRELKPTTITVFYVGFLEMLKIWQMRFKGKSVSWMRVEDGTWIKPVAGLELSYLHLYVTMAHNSQWRLYQVDGRCTYELALHKLDIPICIRIACDNYCVSHSKAIYPSLYVDLLV
ncbi:unnamed protein product [Lathyrus sativus]|nr:unnamed protein product [Lathyrus sativus]